LVVNQADHARPSQPTHHDDSKIVVPSLTINADCKGVSELAAEPVLTVVLEGPDISLSSFATAVSALDSLLTALGTEVAPGSSLAWDVQALDVGSAVTTVLGRVISGDPAAPARVTAAFEAIGDALTRQVPIPYSPVVTRHATALTDVLADHVTAIRLETPERDFTIAPGNTVQDAPQGRLPAISLGGVEGRIQTLSNRRSVRFTLYDELDDHAVSCYLKPGEESMIQKFWGLRAVVEGTVRRDSAGRPTTIRDITDVTLLPEHAPDDWLSLRGAWAEAWDGTPAEDAIRKIRDAW
jgi:hypothetical protein